jgi:Ca2+-binding EF-hand superfamily protein
MFKQIKIATLSGLMALAMLGSAQAAIPSSAVEGSEMSTMFWTEARMKAMDSNKDGQVSRKEFMDYMGAQYDKMDAKKDGMLTKAEFMDKKMMAFTFPTSGKE